jgi:hypothetical protein
MFLNQVELAGKIAGNSENKPPIPGPSFMAMIAAMAVINPPKGTESRSRELIR